MQSKFHRFFQTESTVVPIFAQQKPFVAFQKQLLDRILVEDPVKTVKTGNLSGKVPKILLLRREEST